VKRSPLRRKTRLQSRTQLARHTGLRRRRRDLGAARTAVRERAGGRCEAAIEGVCTGSGAHAHHVLRRSQGGPDTPENLLWLCPPCHGHIHENPAWATEQGLLRRAS
jgi:hypothetical protein